MKAPLRTSTVSAEMVINGDLPGLTNESVSAAGWPGPVAGCPTKRERACLDSNIGYISRTQHRIPRPQWPKIGYRSNQVKWSTNGHTVGDADVDFPAADRRG